MAKNLKKFVNPRFTRAVGLDVMRRLLERHRARLAGFDLAVFDGHSAAARAALEGFFAGPEDAYPEGLIADLHRIAELGDAQGLRLILEQAERLGIVIAPERDAAEAERRQDPKHVATRVFLDHPLVFDAASDMLALAGRRSLAEYAGPEEGIEPDVSEATSRAFETAAAAIFEADHQGSYCRVGRYADADEINLVVTHGSMITTTPVVDAGTERVISYRAAEHAVLSYAAATGRLKIGGVARSRRAAVAEIFAALMLERPGFFAAEDSQNLYTLAPIERAGCGFTFNHAFDPGIHRVQIVEVQADRVDLDGRTGTPAVSWSCVARDSRGNALLRLADVMRDRRITSDWRLNHIVAWVHIDAGAARPSRVTVKIKPPATAIFKRHRFEDRIMTLLRRNGFCHERDSDRAAVAAE